MNDLQISTNQLTIIDKPGEFLLKIGDAEIPFVTGYTVTSDSEYEIDLIIKVSVPKGRELKL